MSVFKSLVFAGIIFVIAQPAISSDIIAECNNLLEKGDYRNAVAKGKMAVEQHSRNIDAHLCLAESWQRSGEFKLALQQMKVADSLVLNNDYLALRLALNEINEAQLQIIQKELSLKISNKLGSLYGSLRSYALAINEFNRSVNFAKELGSKDDQALALTNMATAHSALGENSKALDDYREALKLTSRDSEVSSLYNNMAVVSGNMGEFASAEDYFAMSLALDEKNGDKRAQAMHLLNHGLTKQALKDYVGAAKLFTKSLQLAHDAKAVYWEGVANRAFGDLYSLLGNVKLARDAYGTARSNFSAAHAIDDMKNIDGIIEELYVQRPLASIDINPEGVKLSLLAMKADNHGNFKFKDILHQSVASFKIVSKDGEALSAETIDSIIAGAAAAAKVLITERKLAPIAISLSLTGISPSVSNRDVLLQRISKEIGITPVVMTSSEMAKYDFNGRVLAGGSNSAVLIKVSSDTTNLSTLDSKSNDVVALGLKQGAFTAARQQVNNRKISAQAIINGEQKTAFSQAIRSKSVFISKKQLFIEGDIARTVAVFTHPDQDGNLVKITIADLDKFVTAVRKKATPYFNPNLKNIKDSNVQIWAESEINWVKQNFDPDELMAGVQYLKMILGEFKAKEAFVSRSGNWSVGRLYESVLLANKIEGGYK